MLSFSSRNIFSLLCAGAVLSLVGCGGNSSNEDTLSPNDDGLAPDSLSGYMLQVNPENSDPSTSPGPLNISGGAGTGLVGYVNAGTEYTSGVQTIFNKIGSNTAQVSCQATTPDNPENPTTEKISFTAIIHFTSKTTSSGVITGELVSWTYKSWTAGNATPSSMEGTSGSAKLIPLQ